MPCMGDDYDPDEPGRTLMEMRERASALGWTGRLFIVRTKLSPFTEMVAWCREHVGPGFDYLHGTECPHDARFLARCIDDTAADFFVSRFAFSFSTEAEALHFAIRWAEAGIEAEPAVEAIIQTTEKSSARRI